MNNNNILTLSCKWYINTFKNLPIIVLIINDFGVFNQKIRTVSVCLKYFWEIFKSIWTTTFYIQLGKS